MSMKTPIPFEAFMHRALYDPERGYYARRIRGLGKRGDFTTAPMLTEALGSAIADWAVRALRETGCRDLIEIGPGEGWLAADVWRKLPALTRWKSRLHLVETSPPLAAIQRETLGKHATWHTTPGEALAACGGRAVIFSNELVDAFPVRRFAKTPAAWQEIAVGIAADGTATESLLPPAALPPSSGFADIHAPGQRIEVHDSYRRWLLDWLPSWRAGRLLTIDYGATADRLYERRPHGTVRGYLLHQRLEGPAIYQNPGRQDLTADVNFTDLIEWSAPWTGASRLQTLAAFLNTPAKRRHAGIGKFLDDQDAGGHFLVLDQACRAGG
jgi:SAM-dependent MidA family methyltransferase